MRTLKKMQKEYEAAQKAATEAGHRCHTLEKEITDYKLQHEMYFPMSELVQYEDVEIACITLVARGENGELFTKEVLSDMYLTVDEDGHLYGLSEHEEISYDEISGKYLYQEYNHGALYDFIGYMEIDFFDREKVEYVNRTNSPTM